MPSLPSTVSAFLRRLYLCKGLYWRISGHRQLSIGQSTASFRTDTIGESLVVEYSFQTERPVLRNLLEELESEDVFYDIGANYGFYSCFAASVLPTAHIYAFEPYDPNLSRLRSNHELNGVTDIQVIEKALSDSNGQVTFDSPSRYRTMTGTSAMRPNGDDSYTVRTSRGDSLVESEKIPAPSVIKIDVEGAEMSVLNGFKRTLSSPACRVIYCEIHRGQEGPSIHDFGASPADVYELLEDAGFSIETIQQREDEKHIKASKG